MTHKYTLRSGEQWESEFYPLDPSSSLWRTEIAVSSVICHRCSADTAGEVYKNQNHGSSWCPKCFKARMVEADSDWPRSWLPVSLAHPWFTEAMEDAGWVVLEDAEREEMLAWLAENESYTIPPALYPEVMLPLGENDPVVEELVVHAGSDLPKRALGLTTTLYGAPHGYSHISRTCSVCGRGVAREPLYARSSGIMHISCLNWFIANELAEDYGLIHFTTCGHWSRQRPAAAALKCADCSITAPPSSCSECLNIRDGRWRCDLHRTLYHLRMSCLDLVPLGVDPGFNIFAALADFYILTDLHDRAREMVQPEYVRRVKEIANAIARYTIMATGGEARHWAACRRNDRFCTVEESIDPEQDSYWCPASMAVDRCQQTLCQFADKHKKVVHYQGIAADGRWCNEGSHVGQSVTNGPGCRIDGVWHPFQNNHALWEPVGLDMERQHFAMPRREGRAIMWALVLDAFKEHGQPVLEALVTMFSTGEWNGSYGGENWARPARLVRDYAAGKLTPPMFIDLIFGVQHNNGSLFNKLWALDISGQHLIYCLDVRRKMTSSLVLLPFASDNVRRIWGETAGRTQDPELLLGARLWLSTINDPKCEASWDGRARLFSTYLRRYNRRYEHGTNWRIAALTFRLLAKDKPTWRKVPRVSSGMTRKKKQEAVAIMAAG